MQESGENYLETILILKNKNGLVRSIDVARELGVSKPSVSRAIGILKEDGFLTVEPGGDLNLTREGLARADSIYDRHRTLTKFLNETLCVPADTAEADACRIEHVISEETFDKMKEFMSRGNAGTIKFKKGTAN